MSHREGDSLRPRPSQPHWPAGPAPPPQRGAQRTTDGRAAGTAASRRRGRRPLTCWWAPASCSSKVVTRSRAARSRSRTCPRRGRRRGHGAPGTRAHGAWAPRTAWGRRRPRAPPRGPGSEATGRRGQLSPAHRPRNTQRGPPEGGPGEARLAGAGPATFSSRALWCSNSDLRAFSTSTSLETPDGDWAWRFTTVMRSDRSWRDTRHSRCSRSNWQGQGQRKGRAVSRCPGARRGAKDHWGGTAGHPCRPGLHPRAPTSQGHPPKTGGGQQRAGDAWPWPSHPRGRRGSAPTHSRSPAYPGVIPLCLQL